MNVKLLKNLIKLNPRMITRIIPKSSNANSPIIEELIQYAIECGYTPTKNDLMKSEILSKSPSIKKACENSYPPLDKYFIFNYSSGLINEELDKLISKTDLKYHIVDLLEDHPILLNAYNGEITDYLIDICVANGYIPDRKFVSKNKYLSSSDQIIRMLLDKNANDIRLYTGENEELFKEAINKGFKPNQGDLNKPNFSKSKSIMMHLLNIDKNLILKYKGNDEEVINYAINNGFNVNYQSFLANKEVFSSSDTFMRKLIDLNLSYIYEYTGNNEEIFTYAYKKMTEDDIPLLLDNIRNNRNISKSNYIINKVIFGDNTKGLNEHFEFIREDINIDSESLKNIISDPNRITQNFLNAFSNNESAYFEIVSAYPNLIEYYKNWKSKKAGDLIMLSISKGYKPSIGIIENVLLNNDEDNFDLWLYAHSREDVSNNISSHRIFSYLDDQEKYLNVHDDKVLKLAVERFGYVPEVFDINEHNISFIPPKLLLDIYDNENMNYLLYLFRYNSLDINKTIDSLDESSLNPLYRLLLLSNGYGPNIPDIIWNKIKTLSKGVDINSRHSHIFELDENLYESFPEWCKDNIFEEFINDISLDKLFIIAKLSLKRNVPKERFDKVWSLIASHGKESIKGFGEYLINSGFTMFESLDDKIFDDIINELDFNSLCKISIVISNNKKTNLLENKFLKVWNMIEKEQTNNVDSYRETVYSLNFNNIPNSVFESIINNSSKEDLYKVLINLSKNKMQENDILRFNITINKLISISSLEEVIKQLSSYPFNQYIYMPIEYFNQIIKHVDLDSLFDVACRLSKIRLFDKLSEAWDEICKRTNQNLSLNYQEILLSQGAPIAKKFFEVFKGEEEFKKEFEIDFYSFIKYSFNHFKTLIDLYASNQIDEFIEIKNYFVNNGLINIGNTELAKAKNVFDLLNSYLKNPSIYREIIKIDNISDDLKAKIIDSLNLLNNTSLDDNSIRTLNDLINIKDKYVNIYKGIVLREDISLDELKNEICKMLFNMDLNLAKKRLRIYGNTEDFKITAFNNRNNKEIREDISNIIVMISTLESIVLCDDVNKLKNIASLALKNNKELFDILLIFSSYDEIMKNFYEKELDANLTKINLDANLSGLLDLKMTQEYGVDVLDFSDKKYCLLEHSISRRRETPEGLANGIDETGMITICSIIGSNRDQKPFDASDILFATDTLPNDRFIRSSSENMSSNGSVKNVSEDKDKDVSRDQRGALEISTGSENSEVLTYREGIKYKYIVLLGGRKPDVEEIEIAKKYNLKFIKVQERGKDIPNPKDIDSKYLVSNEKKKVSHDLNEVNHKIKENPIMKSSDKKPRRIAIFTDAHALFEPTLAILEDARKEGISEIYSLGDNIGTGPNPKEVLELLEEYGVKSVVGNHELYSLGIDKLSKELINHLNSTGALEEARTNSKYTRSQLTKEQLDEISKYPESRVIELGGKKIYLTHFSREYDSEHLKPLSNDINEVFQGHTHFSNEENKDGVKYTTVRGTGIGDNISQPKASYIILTEREDGYEVEVRNVQYNSRNLYHSINESELTDEEKGKIKGWSGVSR